MPLNRELRVLDITAVFKTTHVVFKTTVAVVNIDTSAITNTVANIVFIDTFTVIATIFTFKMTSIKVSKPDKYDETDTIFTIIRAWIYAVEEYMKLVQISSDIQTRLADTWLSEITKVWYINIYVDVKSLSTLDHFLQVFREHHQRTDHDLDILRRIEIICQETRHTVAKYESEYKMLVLKVEKEIKSN
jgi:hypothetical protein